MENRDPRPGETPAEDVSEQKYPGIEEEMKPDADHGEDSYRGSGKLEGLVALITGGDSGIGRAVAIAFAREGADVVIGYLADREDEDAEVTRDWVEKAGAKCILHKFDVRDPAECRNLVELTVKELGGLDILVNNAAYQMSQDSLLEVPDEQIERTFRTNIFGYIYMVKAALPHLDAGASIINTGSVTALKGNPLLIDYSATKGAIHAFTKALASNLADKGIRVNCVAPGPVWTPLIPSTFDHEDVVEFGADTVWERPAQPAELAPSYVFLASTDSTYYTGEIMAPTGEVNAR